MIGDAQTLLSNSQGPFNTGTNLATNYYDAMVKRDWGRGEPIELIVTVIEGVTGTNSTCNIQLVSDDNTSFTTPTVLWQTGALAVAALPAGTVFKVKVPRQNLAVGSLERYVTVQYVVASANQDTGKFTAEFVLNGDDYLAYPRAGYAVA